jgi:hypothetical protein
LSSVLPNIFVRTNFSITTRVDRFKRLVGPLGSFMEHTLEEQIDDWGGKQCQSLADD